MIYIIYNGQTGAQWRHSWTFCVEHLWETWTREHILLVRL